MKTAIEIIHDQLLEIGLKAVQIEKNIALLEEELDELNIATRVLTRFRERLQAESENHKTVCVGVNEVVPESSPEIPCGGCGATSSDQRCIGCLHDFNPKPTAIQKDIKEIIDHRPKSNAELITEFVTQNPGLFAYRIAVCLGVGKKTKGAISCAVSTMISKGLLYRDENLRIFASKPPEPVKLTTPPESKYLDRIVTFLSVAGPATIEVIADGTKIPSDDVVIAIETSPHVTFLREKDRYSVQG